MRFPINDWQFWVVTGAFVLAMAYLLRGVLPWPGGRRRRRGRRVDLTVSGRSIKRP